MRAVSVRAAKIGDIGTFITPDMPEKIKRRRKKRETKNIFNSLE